MSLKEKFKEIFKPRLKLLPGTRLTSFLFIAASIAIAFGILFAANIYYNIDTSEVIVEEIQRVTNVLRATGGAIVGGTPGQNPAAGYVFEVVGESRLATTSISVGRQLRLYDVDESHYVAFKAPSDLTVNSVYTWPTSTAPAADYILAAMDTAGTLYWVSPAAVGGDITAVGNVETGRAFTSDVGTQYGNILWFHPNATYTMAVTAADGALTANATTVIPAVSGTNYLALGTSTAGYVAYWTGTNILAGEQYLSTTRGGIGKPSNTWNGMVRVVGGDWGPITGTAGYAAYWLDANTVAAEQYLAVSRGGTGKGSWTQWGVLYADTTGSLTNTGAGTTYQILTANTGAAPSWRNISELVFAENGLTITGTATTTLRLGGTLTQDTTIAQGNYNLIFALTGTGDFIVENETGTDILTVTDDDRILFKTYPLAESGKEVLRAIVPIFGFDLPSQTATTSFVQISKEIQDYPFSDVVVPAGATSTHRFIIRIASATTTASTTWQVWNVTDATSTASFTFVLDQSTDLTKGEVYISPIITIPLDTDDWRLEMQTNGQTVRVYQIFLARYDQIL